MTEGRESEPVEVRSVRRIQETNKQTSDILSLFFLFYKIPELRYLVRRLDGTPHPLYPDAAAVAWTDAGYIEFMDKAFLGGSIPTNPDAPNGETLVTPTFRIRDNMAGFTHGYLNLRDPQGIEQGFWVYTPNRFNLFPSGDPSQWTTHTWTRVWKAGTPTRSRGCGGWFQ